MNHTSTESLAIKTVGYSQQQHKVFMHKDSLIAELGQFGIKKHESQDVIAGLVSNGSMTNMSGRLSLTKYGWRQIGELNSTQYEA